MTSEPRTCAECWLFVAIECDDVRTAYGICDVDGEQVLAENTACDRGRMVTKWGAACAGGDES